MNRQKVKEIVKFSLRRNIQNKWFVILNIILFILIICMLNAKNINHFLEEKNINLFNDNIKIEYIDQENLLKDSLEKAFEEYSKIEVEKIKEYNYTKDNIDNNIVIEIFSNEKDIIKAKIISKEGIDSEIYNVITNVLNEKRTEIFSIKNNVEKSKLDKLEEGISIERIMLGVDSENSQKKEVIQYISTMLVYIISIFIFSKIANDVAQEKVSRSIEYVLTSVTAKEYLFSKIVSIVLLVLFQAVYLLVYYCIGNIINNLINMSYTSSSKIVTNVLTSIDLDLLKYILIVFVYGVLTIILMSIIQAALSSRTTSIQEAGNTMMFLLTISISVYILTFVLITPYTNMSIWIYILSCIPLISNFFIPAIIIIGQSNIIQILISLSLLIISIPIAFNICSKIFKNGVLDYKENSKKKKVKKELSVLEEQELKIDKSRFRKFGFVVSFSILLFIITELILNVLLEILVVPVVSNFIDKTTVDIIYQIIVSAGGLSLASYFVYLYIPKIKNKKTINKKNAQKMLIISIFLVGIFQILLILVQLLLGIDNDVSKMLLEIDGLENPINCILFFVEIAVTPAIFEELFFRKGMIDLSKQFGEKFAIIFSSFIFAISHMNFSQAIFAFIMGIVLGRLYLKTGTMKYNFLLHLLNNGYAAIAEILLFNKFIFISFIYEIVIIFILSLGGILFVKEIAKKIKNKEKIDLLAGRIFPENFKYILTDYTVLVSIIFTVLLFYATELILK